MSLFLLSVLSSWAVPPAFAQTSTGTFFDVPSDYWAYAYIEAIYSAGITVGCGSENYCPSEDVTRGQMAAFIIRALYGETFSYTQKPYFTDVPATDSFFKYIQKLKDMNITTLSGAYFPSEGVTRDEMAAFLVRARQVKAGQPTESFTYTQTPYFTDVLATDPYFTYVQNSKDNGITGVAGTYDPNEIVPRDQMAAFIARAFLANNVLPISVNGSACNNYPNEPCVSVTVCTPGTSTCQTIDGILLDTGSYGLRIFNKLLTVPLTQVTSGPGSLAECASFGSGSTWGPVQMADVILGNEPAVEVPIQVIDQAFGTAPGSCETLFQNPSSIGFNGVLGVGPHVYDCGLDCVSYADNKQYYLCTGTTCSGTAAGPTFQVRDPVASLPTDNNGLIVELPGVLSGGQPSVNGILVLGIGTLFNNTPFTSTNNTPDAVTAYALDQNGEFITTFNNIAYSNSFVDTGSNYLHFSSSNLTSLLPACQDAPAFFCPSSIENLSAAIEGAAGSPSGGVSFQIGNADTLIESGNKVFSDIGVDESEFDWGLPFFFGRNVYIGFEDMSTILGPGPYVAY